MKTTYPLSDDGLAYVMTDAQKVEFLNNIAQELNRMPQSANSTNYANVHQSLEFLRDRVNEVIEGLEDWRWRTAGPGSDAYYAENPNERWQ